MSERHLIAYSLILIMASAISAIVWWKVYHGHARSYARLVARRRRQQRETLGETPGGPHGS